MRTRDNRLMVLAIALRAAHHTITNELPANGDRIVDAIDSILTAAEQLETLAQLPGSDTSGEVPSVDEMLEWACENVCEFRKVRGKVRVIWIDATLVTRSKYGTDWRDAITKAMAEAKASEQTTQVTEANT